MKNPDVDISEDLLNELRKVHTPTATQYLIAHG